MEYVKPFVSKMRKIGRGRGALFPQHIYKYAELEEGDFVEIIVRKIPASEALAKKQALNSEAKAAGKAEGLELGLVRASVQDLAFSGSKEDYLSGKFAIPVSEESWAEQYALGWPNKNLDPSIKLKVLGDKFV